MTPKVPNVKLSNGKEIPIIGLGTWKSKPDQVREAVKVAIDIGYRHLDCAFVYGNEAEIGEAIREKIADKTLKRKDLFITSKCWNSFHRREKVLEGCKMSLKNLGLDYLDLYLIHWPFTYEEGDNLSPKNGKGETFLADIDYVETWKGMEDCYKKGLVKSIGLSNFNSEQIKRVLENCTVKPVMLQIECHPYLNQDKLIEFCKERDIAVTAYSPLGSPDRPWGKSDEPCLLEDPRIKSIAEKHSKTPAQVLIRYQAQRGIVVIPKSVTPERIRSNFQIFDFTLSSDEMSTIGSFKERFRYCAFERLKHVPNWPFNIEF